MAGICGFLDTQNPLLLLTTSPAPSLFNQVILEGLDPGVRNRACDLGLSQSEHCISLAANDWLIDNHMT